MSILRRSCILTVVTFIGLIGFSYVNPEKLEEDFWGCKGRRIVHIYKDTIDEFSDSQIIELQDKDSIPIWFARHIFKDVCISGKCKMIRLWLFWDGVGNYFGFQLHENEPLTKSDHTIFEQADYEKLEEILRDSTSILGKLKQEDLVIIPDSIDNPYELDGYTAATQPSLAEVVVKDAVYTCHTLWHTVYGATREEINRLLEERIDADFLRCILKTGDIEKIIWVIETVKKHPEYHPAFYPDFIECIKSKNELLARKALNYFGHDMLTDELIQKELVSEMPFFTKETNVELIWRFIENGGVTEDVFLQLLQYIREKKLQLSFLNLIYQLIQPHYLKKQEIKVILESFLKDENAYVRSLTKKVLETN